MPVVVLDLDSSKSVKGLRQYDRAVASTEKATDSAFGKMRASANGYATAVIAGMAAATAAVGALIWKTIQAASNMEETQGKFDVVFRNLGTFAEDAAIRIANSYGESEQATKQYLSSVQDLLVPTGLARDEAAKMSISFVELAADLGSFNNMKTADVVRDIQSALAGGSETMTKYGIDVKVAAVNAEMLKLGLDTSTKAAERQSRTTALLSIMQRDSSDAMGDFARTQGSFANQTKIATARIKDMVTMIGQKLLPIATNVITSFNEWITTEGRVNTIVNTTIEVVRFLVNGYLGLELAVKGVIVIIASLAQGLVRLLIPFKYVLEVMQYIGAIDSNPIKNLEIAIDDFAASAVEGFGNTLDKIEALNKALDDTKTKTEVVTAAVEKEANAFQFTGDVSKVAATKSAQGQKDLEAQVERVVSVTNASAQAFNSQAVAATKAVTAFDKMKDRNAAEDAAGYDSHQRSSSGSFSAHGGALSDEEWQGLAQWQKDFLIKKGLEGRTSYDYFNNSTGNRFQDAGGYDQGALAITAKSFAGVSVTNNFNQQISVSDVEQISQQQTTVEARA